MVLSIIIYVCTQSLLLLRHVLYFLFGSVSVPLPNGSLQEQTESTIDTQPEPEPESSATNERLQDEGSPETGTDTAAANSEIQMDAEPSQTDDSNQSDIVNEVKPSESPQPLGRTSQLSNPASPAESGDAEVGSPVSPVDDTVTADVPLIQNDPNLDPNLDTDDDPKDEMPESTAQDNVDAVAIEPASDLLSVPLVVTSQTTLDVVKDIQQDSAMFSDEEDEKNKENCDMPEVSLVS